MPASTEPTDFPPDLVSNFDRFCGLEIVEAGPEEVRARTPIKPELLQPTGVVHGGVYATIAEGIASLGSNLAVRERGQFSLGMSNLTSFMRSTVEGSINSVARRIHLGAGTSVWEVQMKDDDGRVCAVSRVTLALREPRARDGRP